MEHTQEMKMLDVLASEYLVPDAGRVIDRKILAMIVDRTMPWLAGPEILELGYGDDAWTASIVRLFGHTSVVDASGKLLAAAQRKHGPAVVTHQALFEEFVPPRCFNTIVASFILEHVVEPVTILRRAAGWLERDGRIIVIVPNAGSLHRQVALQMGLLQHLDELGETDRMIGHRRVYTVATLEQDIARAGLAVVERRGYFAKFLPQGMMTGFSDDLLQGFMRLGETLPLQNACSLAYLCRV